MLLFVGRGRGDARPPRAFIGALAFGVGYLVAYTSMVGLPRLPSAGVQIATHEWLAWFVVGAIALAPLREFERWKSWSGAFYLILFSVVSLRFPLEKVLTSDLSGLAVRFVLTLALFLAWSSSDSLAARLRGPALPAAWMITGVLIALSALFAGLASFAQFTGAVTAALGAAAVVGLIDRGTRFSSGAVAITWLVFAGALINAGIYDLSRVSIGLLVLALLAPWIVATKRFEGRPLAAMLVAMIASAVPAGIAAWIAYEPSPY
jgi:hypothetical protein